MPFPKRIAALFFIVALAFPCRAAVQDYIPSSPEPPRLVNDFASAFELYQADSLETVLVDFDERTSNQISVVTVTDLHDYDVAEFALALANKWGIGSSRNNGVLVLLKTRNGGYVDVTIQVGRGLEGAIPDAYASRIIRNIMGPHLRQDEYWPAVSTTIAFSMWKTARSKKSRGNKEYVQKGCATIEGSYPKKPAGTRVRNTSPAETAHRLLA